MAFVRDIAPPPPRGGPRPLLRRGQALFEEAGCAGCHVPRLRTGSSATSPHLSNREVWLYSDLLVHDMGPDLADDRPDGEASGAEWRTPPLRGVGLARVVNRKAGFLHDGRARTLEEAILWHGGEGRPARDAFGHLSPTDRRALLAFVRSI